MHRERAHLKVPGFSIVLNALLTIKLPTFLSRLNEISGGCEKIAPVSGYLNSAAKKMKPEIAKIGQSFARFQEGDFTLVKTDKSEQEKIYAKIYPSKIPTTDFSCRFWELCPGGERKKKQPILRQKELVNMPLRGSSRFFNQASFLRKCQSDNLHCRRSFGGRSCAKPISF